MLYAFRYASTVPYQMFAIAGFLNMAIILTFVFAIRLVYIRMQGKASAEQIQVSETQSQQSIDSDRRRLKGLWIGVGLYSLIFLNGIRLGFAYAGKLPLVTIILGEALNGAILATFIVTLRKVQKRIHQAEQLASDR